MKSIKLYFSDKSEQTREGAISRVVKLLSDNAIVGGTITRTIGIWRGETEPGFMLEIISSTPSMKSHFESIARRLVLEYSQNSVLMSTQDITSAVLVSRYDIDPL